MQQTVRCERVSGALSFEVVVKAVLGGTGVHVALHLRGTILGKAVLVGQVRRGFDGVVMWSTRIELERTVNDLDLVLERELLECILEAALTEIAPRTHDV